ncbi:MAG TPA: iron-containing alcohol dehydrogenase [Hyphomicrobiales bacterium]|nr:iron-containing alcohol dehydrogenase [Hyphomicrobiales bacterium]
MTSSVINYLTTIHFGEDAVTVLPGELSALSISRPLIVTDKPLCAVGVVDQALAPLGETPPIFDATPSNPTEEACDRAAAMYRQEGCDGLIAIGGGSPIDLAKAIALRVTHDGPLAQYAVIEGGLARITASVAPVIAVPTTSGTGAEVGRASLLTVHDGRKLGIISPYLIPKRAICDPKLTYGLPPYLTAATGMDALTHCFETFLSPRYNPVADSIALDGLVRAWRNIRGAVANGGDADARREMMMASLQGGLTFQKGLGAVHSMSHPLGSVKSVNPHHGTLNAVILPHVLAYNENAASEKYGTIRKALGLEPDADLGALITELNAEIGLPKSLAEMGLPRDIIPAMSKAAMADHSTPTNPRAMTEAGFIELFERSFS